MAGTNPAITHSPSAPVRRDPDVAVAVPPPVTRNIGAGPRTTDCPVSADPHIAIAVPVPVARLPEIAGTWWRHHFVLRRRDRTIGNRRLRHRWTDAEAQQHQRGPGCHHSLHFKSTPVGASMMVPAAVTCGTESQQDSSADDLKYPRSSDSPPPPPDV